MAYLSQQDTADLSSIDGLDLNGPVDWSARLAREGPALLELLSEVPSRRLLDLGCGRGEHARYLAQHGFEVLGIDADAAALEQAGRATQGDNPVYQQGEIGAVEAGVRGHYGAALCLGNTLPCLIGTESVARMLVGLRRRLLPGAPLILHQLGFDRLWAQRQRSLPAVHLPTDDGSETVVLRLLEPRADGILILTAAALSHCAGGEPPLEIQATRSRFYQGWQLQELQALLDVARFPHRQSYGSWELSPYHPIESEQLILVAR